jgi:hypothetical protein
MNFGHPYRNETVARSLDIVVVRSFELIEHGEPGYISFECYVSRW